MKIENISVGQIFKNYVELSNTLEQKPKTSDSKKKQLREWSQFFKFDKVGHKFIILEIYEKPKVKVSERFGYVNDLQEMFINILAQHGDETMFMSKNKLFRILNLTNGNYAVGRQNMNKLSALINIDKDNIIEFYNLSRDMFIYNIDKVLDELQNKRLIRWSDALTLCRVDSTADRIKNEKGKTKLNKIYKGIDEEDRSIYDYGIVHQTKYKHEPATDSESKMITRIERAALEALGVSSMSEAIRCGKYLELRKMVDPIVWDKLNVTYYYESYKILPNYEVIVEANKELEGYDNELERNMKEFQLNSNTQVKLDMNAINRYQKALKDPDKNEASKRRSEENYVDIQMELSTMLVDVWYEDIRKNIKSVNLKSKSETLAEEKFIENLKEQEIIE